MGKVEKVSRKRRKKDNLQKIILKTVQVAGLLSVALLAPNALSGMKKLGLLPTSQVSANINRSRQNLIQKGLLRYENGFLCLTQLGILHLNIIERKNRQIEKPKRWDKH